MMTPLNLVIFIDALLFLLGMSTFLAGIFILAFRAANTSDVKTLAAQTARLANKGITEDMAGLVGNASDLLDATNQLVRTTQGVGIFLTAMGLVLMGAASWVAIQIYRIQP
jgi:hypothetical protein